MSTAVPLQASPAFGDGFRMLLAAAGNGALLAELIGVRPSQVTIEPPEIHFVAPSR